MLLFLDTEYTGLGQPDPGLISLALITEDARRELYVELADTWQPADCTGFVRWEVLPRLDGSPRTLAQARVALATGWPKRRAMCRSPATR